MKHPGLIQVVSWLTITLQLEVLGIQFIFIYRLEIISLLFGVPNQKTVMWRASFRSCFIETLYCESSTYLKPGIRKYDNG